MNSENKNVSLSSHKFPEDALLIFIGHSDDAREEALAIVSLQSTIENEFRKYLELQHQKSQFHSLKLWEWHLDASSKTGGQKHVVDPALNRAQITIFVFKERVGNVTWEELEKAKKRSKENLVHILAFFPDHPPKSVDFRKRRDAEAWLTLLKHKEDLTVDWTQPDSCSITPCPDYENIEHLKIIAREKLLVAIHNILSQNESPRNKISSASACLIGDIKDINFDRRPMLSHTVDDLDKNMVEKFISKPLSLRLFQEENLSSYSTDTDRLTVLGCVTGNCPTLGAFLCFAPSRLIINKFGSCSLHVVRYKGTSRTLSAIETFPMHDNLLNLFERGMYWLVSEAHLGRQGLVGSLDRDDLEIPEIALREALANALVHRDYENTEHRDQPTRVEVYDNRVEITSFGTLPSSINIDQLNQCSEKLTPVRRNPVIAQIFYHMTNVELNASGIARMRYAMQKALLPPPTIIIQNGAVVVCFERPILIEPITNKSIEIRKRALIGGALSGLDPFKKEVIAACFQAGYFPVMMEHHPADVTDAISLSSSMVDNVDLYIGIWTHQYGYVPAGYDKSIYEMEYSRVKTRNDLPRLLFSLKQNIIENNASENKFYSQKQLNFLDAVARESVLVTVRSAEEFKTQLIIGFKNLVDGFTDVERYHARLKEDLGKNSIFGMPGIDGDKEAVDLPDTLVPLDISVNKEHQQQGVESSEAKTSDVNPEDALHYAVERSRMLLIIGEPGSGKTTIIKHFALSHTLRLKGFAFPVPIFYMPLSKMATPGEERQSLHAKLSQCFEPHLEIEKSFFEDRLKNQPSLLLLDGLDEISEETQRVKICTWVSEAAKTWKKAFFVITTRDKGYGEKEQNALKIDKEIAWVKRFSEEQQRLFLQKWFRAAFLRDLHRDEKGFGQQRITEKEQDAAKSTIALDTYLTLPENRGLRNDLAGIPLLLQLMAILWKQSNAIPENREEIYRVALDYLLFYRENEKNISPFLPATVSKQLLEPLSLWMQDRNQDAADINQFRDRMQQEVDNLHYKYRSKYSAEQICENLVTRAGVLGKSGSTYVFSHKTFREYLAGLRLVKCVTSEPDRIGKLVEQVGVDWWDEPLLFFMVQVDAFWFNKFIKAFFDAPRSASLDQRTLNFLQKLIRKAPQTVEAFCEKLRDPATTRDRQYYILECLKTVGSRQAVEVAQEYKRQHPEADQELLRKADEVVLTDEQERSAIPVIKRELVVGSAKPNGDVHFSSIEQNAQYIFIKNGSHSVDGKKQAEDIYVAKYPLTNKLYRKFITWLQSVDNGHADDILKDNLFELAKTIPGFQTCLGEEPELSKQFRSKYDDDRRFKEDDQPVVGVSWYAACTYCLWLSLMESNGQDTKRYRLPIEREWEYAAAGKEKRAYPWPKEKGEPNSKLLNYNGNVGATTPVGSYPEGATPEGLYDMAGNVWEWTDSWWDEKTCSSRVIRGGSWGSTAEGCRSADRNFAAPSYRDNLVGFRLSFVQ